MTKQWQNIPIKDNAIFLKMLEDKNKQARAKNNPDNKEEKWVEI